MPRLSWLNSSRMSTTATCGNPFCSAGCLLPGAGDAPRQHQAHCLTHVPPGERWTMEGVAEPSRQTAPHRRAYSRAVLMAW